MEPIKQIRALYSDETKQYRTPMEPQTGDVITIRFRTGRDTAEQVCLISGEERYAMKRTQSDELFDYHQIELELGAEPFYYYFEIKMGDAVYTYNRRGVNGENIEKVRS